MAQDAIASCANSSFFHFFILNQSARGALINLPPIHLRWLHRLRCQGQKVCQDSSELLFPCHHLGSCHLGYRFRWNRFTCRCLYHHRQNLNLC